MTSKRSGVTTKTRPLTKDGPFPKAVAESGGMAAQAELCAAKYSATSVQIPDGGDEVFIQASGVHPTSGYEVFFQKSPLDVYPPEFSLWHVKPSGPALDVITPFSRFTGFKTEGPVKQVTITDANGRHTLTVQKLGTTIVACE